MSRKQRERQERRQVEKRKQRLLIGGVVLLFIAILAVFTWQQTGGSQALTPSEVPDPTLGSQVAPVEIVEYADFGCPACRAWHNSGIREQVLATFGDQVRFIWRDFPVITPQSPKAAEAGHCAGVQGKFWEYHDLVYENGAGLHESLLKQYADQLELDRTAFDNCLDQGLMARKVQANEQQARALGLRGTPGFTVNGRLLPAPPSYEQLAAEIQQVSTQ